MHAERALICLEEHFGSQLVEYERNMPQGRLQHDEDQSAKAEEDRNGECSRACSRGARGCGGPLSSSWRQRHSTTLVLMLKNVANDLRKTWRP